MILVITVLLFITYLLNTWFKVTLAGNNQSGSSLDSESILAV